jgi:hypothetical protein
MAARKFASANLKLSEQVTKKVTHLQDLQKDLTKCGFEAIRLATAVSEASSGKIRSVHVVHESVLTYLKLLYTLAETCNTAATALTNAVKQKQDIQLLPPDLKFLEHMSNAVQRILECYTMAMHKMPLRLFGNAVAQTIELLTDQCQKVQEASLFNAQLFQTVFETFLQVNDNELDDFMLGKFYECLLECKQLHLRDTYPMAMQQRLPKYADSSLSDWVDVLRQKTRDSLDAPRTPVTPLDQGPGPKGAAFALESETPQDVGSMLKANAAQAKTTLTHLRSFNLWSMWLFGCVADLSALSISSFCSRMLTTPVEERYTKIIHEVLTYMTDPDFQFLEKVCLIQDLIVAICTVPVLLLKEAPEPC